MACELSTVQTQACESEIGKVSDKIKLLQLMAQLSCEISEASGGGGSGGVIDPDGVVSGTQYQTYWNSANDTLWINTDGGTTWHQLI